MSNLRTPLHPWHVAHAARMVPFGGWDMPVQYAGIVAEHHAVRAAAGLFDISHMGRLSLSGADALPFLEGLFTNAVATMRVGQVRYGFLCREDGGTLDDVLLYRWTDGFLLVANASSREKVVAWLESRRAGMAVAVEDQTAETAMIAVQGPTAVGSCAGLFDIDAAALPYYHAARAVCRARPCVVSRTGYTGEDGLEVIVPADLAIPLWEELAGRGAVPCGLGARDTLRLEAAMPLYGHELGETIDPVRAGLGWAVKLDKGDFVGRAALADAAAHAAARPGASGSCSTADGRPARGAPSRRRTGFPSAP